VLMVAMITARMSSEWNSIGVTNVVVSRASCELYSLLAVQHMDALSFETLALVTIISLPPLFRSRQRVAQCKAWEWDEEMGRDAYEGELEEKRSTKV